MKRIRCIQIAVVALFSIKRKDGKTMYITSDLVGASFPLIIILGELVTAILTKMDDQEVQRKAIGAILGIDLREKPQDLRVTSCSKEAEGKRFKDFWIVARMEDTNFQEIATELNLHEIGKDELGSVPFGFEGPDCGKEDARWWKAGKVEESDLLMVDDAERSRVILVSYHGKMMYLRMSYGISSFADLPHI